MDKNKINMEIGDGLLLKYGLCEGGKLPYEYLAQYHNGFVYFKDETLIETLLASF